MPYEPVRHRLALAAAALWMLAASPVLAYEEEAPRGIHVDVVYLDAGTDKPAKLSGELFFTSLPTLIDGRTPRSFGMKELVPKEPGDIWIRRDRKAEGKTPVFTLHEYRGEYKITFPFESIPVELSDTGQLDESIADDHDAPRDESLLEKLDEAIEEAETGKPAADGEEEPAVRLGLRYRPSFRRIPVEQLESITFKLPEHYRREKYRGRFVAYSKAAKGSNGIVQPAAATWFGGESGSESFSDGGFLPDGSILLLGSFHDLSFVEGATIHVIGTDPEDTAFQPEPLPKPKPGDKKRRRPPPHPRLTPVLVQYTADLRRIERITRLPWAAGTLSQALWRKDGSVYLTGHAGGNFEALERPAARKRTVENPAAVEKAKQRNRTPPGDSFVLQLTPDQKGILWLVRFRHARIYAGLHPDGSVLVERDKTLFYVRPDGAVDEGPRYNEDWGGRARTPLCVSPKDGSIFVGGEYHSGTGREPYRNPFLHKFSDQGECQWTAYNWTGPVVGVDQLRLVSDSAVKAVRFDHDGNLIVTGWSDGGNSVFTRQPYDLHQNVPVYGFAGSIWGAGVLSVPYMIRMDAQTMRVSTYCRWLSYLPLDDVPNGASIKDFLAMTNGDIAFTGGSAFGLIETHDAWVSPWWVNFQTNQYAEAHGGSYLAIFSPDFRKLKFSSVLPAVGNQKLADRGRWLLVFGHAGQMHTSYRMEVPTITRHATQPEFGGGDRDAYVMLIDTQAEPRPPVIPERTWEE